MHKRIAKATPLSSDRSEPIITPQHLMMAKSESKNNPDDFTMPDMTKVLARLRRYNILPAAYMCILFVASAIIIALDNSDSTPYDGHDLYSGSFSSFGVHAQQQQQQQAIGFAGVNKRKSLHSAESVMGMASPQIQMDGIADERMPSFEASMENPFAGSGNDGNDKLIMGEMVLDALESQKGSNPPISKNRMLIYQGNIGAKIEYFALDSTADKIASFVEDGSTFGDGGYVASRSSSENNYYHPSSSYKSKTKIQHIVDLNLRIPSDHFHSSIELIKRLIDAIPPDKNNSRNSKGGKITSLYTNGRDVTDEYVDTTARADTLDSSRKALQVLLSKSNQVDEVIKVHSELNKLTQQSESMRRRALDLKKRSELSDLNVRLEEWMINDGSTDDDDGSPDDKYWSPMKSIYLAWRHVFKAGMFAFDTLMYSLVWAVPCVVIYFAFNVVIRKLRSLR